MYVLVIFCVVQRGKTEEIFHNLFLYGIMEGYSWFRKEGLQCGVVTYIYVSQHELE